MKKNIKTNNLILRFFNKMSARKIPFNIFFE